VGDGREYLRFGKEYSHVKCVAFSPDGRLLASSSHFDPVVHLWEAATGQEVHQFEGHRDEASTLAFAPDGRRLASGSRDHTVLLWDLADSLKNDLGSDPEQCWKDLAGSDARAAFRAVWSLARMPERSVPLLAERLRPVPTVPPGRLERLLADLDSDIFAVRSKASEDLEGLDDVAEPSLSKALRDAPSTEVRVQAERLIAKLEAPVPPAGQLRVLRALAVLEHSGTPEARRVLEKLAQGATEARLTREAKAALGRLERRALDP
jgi:hypothetical protein